MTRAEFIVWLDTVSGFQRKNFTGDDEWRELMNHAEYIWDELTVYEDFVTFEWEEWSWGSIEYRYRDCGFAEFIELYENYELK